MVDRPKDLRVLLGKGGKGKSYLCRHWVKPFNRVIFFDPNSEPENAEGRNVCTTERELLEGVSADKKPFRICWRGFETMGKAAYEFGNEVALAVENCLLVWEECDRFIGPHILPPFADRIINAGRHSHIAVFGLARRAAKVPRDLTGNASRIVIFQSTEPLDKKYVSDSIGHEWAEKLPDLPQFHAIDWTENVTEIKKSLFR